MVIFVHCITTIMADDEVQAALSAIDHGRSISEKKRWKFSSEDLNGLKLSFSYMHVSFGILLLFGKVCLAIANSFN
jgi:hypothetical protein